jgi:hypothetical protein
VLVLLVALVGPGWQPLAEEPAAPAGAPSPAPINTTGWTTYVSERYGFAIGHPADWTVKPSEDDWTMAADQSGGSGEERFSSPTGDILVSAWSAPHITPESPEGVKAWVEEYCQETANTSCATIGGRAVPLCNERWDCHPGMLVPFERDVQAFFTGGNYTQMVVVAVWRPDALGSRELLEAFLSTMDVCPSGCARDVPLAGAVTGEPLASRRLE